MHSRVRALPLTAAAITAMGVGLVAPALAQAPMRVVAPPVTKGQAVSMGFALTITPMVSVQYNATATILVKGKKVVIATSASTRTAYVGESGPAPIDASIPPANTDRAMKAVASLKRATPVTLTFTGNPIDANGIPVAGAAPFSFTVRTSIKK